MCVLATPTGTTAIISRTSTYTTQTAQDSPETVPPTATATPNLAYDPTVPIAVDVKTTSQKSILLSSTKPRIRQLTASAHSTKLLNHSKSDSEDSKITPTANNQSPSKNPPTQTVTTKVAPRPTTTEPTPLPPDVIFLRFPELHPDYKGTSSTKNITVSTESIIIKDGLSHQLPQSTESLNPSSPDAAVVTASYDRNVSAHRLDQQRQQMEAAVTTAHKQSSVTKMGRGATNLPTPIPTLTSNNRQRTTNTGQTTSFSTKRGDSISTTTTRTPATPHRSAQIISTVRTPAPNKVPFRLVNFAFVKPPPRITTTQAALTERYTTDQVFNCIDSHHNAYIVPHTPHGRVGFISIYYTASQRNRLLTHAICI